jgi:glycosyltransferase involved in cell wall biosynthesis
MIIGIDARAAAEVEAGRGRVVRELLEALATLPGEHRFLLYCRTAAELALDSRFDWVLVDASDPIWHVRAARLANRRCDVFLSTNSYLTAWFTRIPTAVLVYDLIAFIPGANAQRRAKLIEHLTIGRAVRRAASLICISNATLQDLTRKFPAAQDKSSVVPLAAAPLFSSERPEAELAEVRRRYGLKRPFVLSTGTLEPRKNLPRLIAAFASLTDDVRRGHQLVIVGPSGWQTDETMAAARANPEDVLWLGFVPDTDLAALYQACCAFCYPSLYEGFGLPLLEALQSGAPSITSNLSSLPEIGGSAARYVDPYDVNQIRAALSEVLVTPELRQELRRRGPEQAASFSWDRSAREMLAGLAGLAPRSG